MVNLKDELNIEDKKMDKSFLTRVFAKFVSGRTDDFYYQEGEEEVMRVIESMTGSEVNLAFKKAEEKKQT